MITIILNRFVRECLRHGCPSTKVIENYKEDPAALNDVCLSCGTYPHIQWQCPRALHVPAVLPITAKTWNSLRVA